LRGRINNKAAAEKLSCTLRTIRRYRQKYIEEGPEGLEDKRRSNFRKLTEKEELRIVRFKLEGKHRSARFIRDRLELEVHKETVRLVLVRHHINRISLPPVKRIERFEAASPNELWQIDIMGKSYFPLIGDLYLICSIDDHSRFIPSGQWFYRKFGINVYQVMYNSFVTYGLPKAILSDKGSQFKAHQKGGQANYQWYAKNLGIKPHYAKKARTKGKIERLFWFIQRDFVMENVKLASAKEVNKSFFKWLNDYNFSHEHEGINKQSPADLYTPSLRKLTPDELEFILVHEEPRKVQKTAAITYYGHYYRVPEEYINRRVWTKLKGSTLKIECGGEVIARYKIREERYKDIPKNLL
jgi:transposase InsO family protein